MVVRIRDQRAIVFDVATTAVVVVVVTAACLPQIANRFFLRAHTLNACETLKCTQRQFFKLYFVFRYAIRYRLYYKLYRFVI